MRRVGFCSRISLTIATLLALGCRVTPLSAADPPILSLKVEAAPAVSADTRVLIGRGKDYQPVGANTDPQVLFDELAKSMKARRDFAWKIVEQMLQPTKLRLPGSNVDIDVPLWQTWYDGRGSSDELTGLFTRFFQRLKANPSADLATVAEETLNGLAQKNLATSVTSAAFTTVLQQNADPRVSTAFGGQGRTMFSPSFVKHMMISAKEVERCSHVGIRPDTPPPSQSNFSHCIQEFPRSAVMIKTAWRELSGGVAIHDTGSAAMTAVINEGTWPAGNHPSSPPTTVPTSNQIYTNETQEGRRFGLAGIHIVTKDVREWVWVSLWWSPDAAKDFGADKPSSIGNYDGGVWSNYKMCVNSAFDEADPQPWSSYNSAQASLGQSIRATYDAIQAHVQNGVMGNIIIGTPDSDLGPEARGPWPAPHNKNTLWCSNPFVEVQPGNGRTSCIGCHQLVLTESRRNSSRPAAFSEAIEGWDPQFARSRNFKNFSADFSWAFQGQYQGIIRSTRRQVGFEWP